jgi:hypothetical protein
LNPWNPPALFELRRGSLRRRAESGKRLAEPKLRRGYGPPALFELRRGSLRRKAEGRKRLAEPKLRSSEGWRPGLDLNQDKEQCTAPASTLSATGPILLSPIAPGRTMSSVD